MARNRVSIEGAEILEELGDVWLHLHTYRITHGSLHVILTSSSFRPKLADIYLHLCRSIHGPTSGGPWRVRVFEESRDGEPYVVLDAGDGALRIEALNIRVSRPLTWHETVSDRGKILWAPIVELSTGVALGISREGDWLVGTDEDTVSLTSPRVNVRLLVLLEQSREEASLKFTRANMSDFEGFSRHLEPIDAAILAGLRSQSEYWAGLALDWLEGVVELSAATRQALNEIVESSAPQQLRHRAREALHA